MSVILAVLLTVLLVIGALWGSSPAPDTTPRAYLGDGVSIPLGVGGCVADPGSVSVPFPDGSMSAPAPLPLWAMGPSCIITGMGR